MADITLTMDGQDVTAREGETILQVAQRLGKNIPTLCHDPRLEPFTSCFVCLVELEGKPGFVPSCATRVAAGMKVRTDSEAVFAARKLCLELLMSAHNADCIAPCRLQCPDNIDIQSYIAHIALGDFDEALKVIKRTNPFPSACGRVCPHSCELQCRRNKVDEPVAINPLKRFVADLDARSKKPYHPPVAADTGKKVAIVGGGPAGLTAAYYLRQQGHAVTVFEMNPKAGGMLRYGIPRYRLPHAELDREIQHVVDLGVELRVNQTLRRDFTLASLKEQGFDAVVLAVGAWVSSSMQVDGENLPGVMAGIDFLFKVAGDQAPTLGKQVVVVGGGNTAIDAARTARRLGAAVTILYRRTRNEMPAEPYEVHEAGEEGVEMQFLAAPVALARTAAGRVQITSIRMELGEPDASGRRKPVPVKGSEFVIEADTVIAAIGQKPDPGAWKAGGAPGATRASTVEANELTYQTSVPWVFTCGDCLTGAATAIEAIAGGRKAALSIDRFLRGQPLLPIGKPFSDSIGRLEDLDDDFFTRFPRKPRLQCPSLSVADRLAGFKEVELTINQDQALQEASRCLSCGCTAVETCTVRNLSDTYHVDPARFESEYQHRPLMEDHPFIIYDPNKCILCGRCVRICDEQQGVAALGFVNRGFSTTIQPALNQPLLATDCDACGQCVSTCPSGALEVRRALAKPGPYLPQRVAGACGFCGVACRLTLECTTQGRYLRVTTEPGEHHNRGNLCVDGQLGHRYLETLDRLEQPQILEDETIRPASVEEAVQTAAQGLARAHSVAVLVNGPLVNEEAYLLQRLARTVWRTNRILPLDGPADPSLFYHALQHTTPAADPADIAQADAIVMIGADPFEYAPVAGIELRQRALGGVPLMVIAAGTTRLDEVARRVVRIGNHRIPDLLNTLQALGVGRPADEWLGMADELGLRPAVLASILAPILAARRPLVVCPDALTNAAANALGRLLPTLGGKARLLVLRRGGNAVGREKLGLHPALLPGVNGRISLMEQYPRIKRQWGGEPVFDPDIKARDVLQGLKAGTVDAVVIVNTDPYGLPLAPESIAPGVFTVLFDLAPGPLSRRAQVVFPAPGLAETSGTVMGLDGSVLTTRAVRPPPGGRALFDLLLDLARAAGQPLPYAEPADVWEEYCQLAGLAAP